MINNTAITMFISFNFFKLCRRPIYTQLLYIRINIIGGCRFNRGWPAAQLTLESDEKVSNCRIAIQIKAQIITVIRYAERASRTL